MDGYENLYKIGELAELSGVPTKTIRFYSDIGALPPTSISESGYRLYSDSDRTRLALIRTLREVGLDLSTIIGLLQRKVSVSEALALQLEAVELELRTLKRQRTLLKSTLQQEEGLAFTYLERARTIAKLNAFERERFLDRHMQRAFAGVPADEQWKADFWQAAVLDLPEELSEAQLEAWLELAELVTSEDFLQRLNEMGRNFWQSLEGRPLPENWRGNLHALYQTAFAAQQSGEPPEGERGQEIVTAYLELQAQMAGGDLGPDYPAHLLTKLEQQTDPRAARYWELIAILKGWQERSPIAIAHDWLVAGLRWRVAQAVQLDDSNFDPLCHAEKGKMTCRS
jgi:DNA-binding transcriptional MerR regulator